MNIPISIKDKIESFASSYNIRDLKKSANKISSLYMEESSSGEPLVFSDIDVLTYAIMRLPATYASTSKALEYGLELIDDKIDSILDIGSGIGTMALIKESILPCASITCVEREKEMINLGKKIAEINYINNDTIISFPLNKADLVSESYFINEIKEESLYGLLDNMWEAANKYLLIVEPGTVNSYQRMMKIREYLVSKGGNVVAPCTHNKKCPITNDWCHFVTRVERSKLHKLLKEADAPYEDEKFTYLFISKNKVKPINARILRHPLMYKGYVELSLCKSNQIIEEVRINKSQKDNYKKAKKSSAGDIY